MLLLFLSGNDLIEDFDTGSNLRSVNRPSDKILIDVEDIESYDALLETATQAGSAILFQVNEDGSPALVKPSSRNLISICSPSV